MGRRPYVDDVKHHKIRVRMNDKEMKELERACERTHMTVSDVIRAGIRRLAEKGVED